LFIGPEKSNWVDPSRSKVRARIYLHDDFVRAEFDARGDRHWVPTKLESAKYNPDRHFIIDKSFDGTGWISALAASEHSWSRRRRHSEHHLVQPK
jgi:hypothetical protein